MLSMNIGSICLACPMFSCLMLRIGFPITASISPSMPSLKTVSSMMPDPTEAASLLLKYQTIWYISLFSCYLSYPILRATILL